MRLIKIGHDGGNDIVLPSDKVSRIHAEITILDNGDILLEDKGSRNGTYVMNKSIAPGTPVKIMRGDAVRFGDTELSWSQVPMPEDNSQYRAIYGVGTHFNNDFQLSGNKVSRYHATIKQGRKDKKFYIVDHSKNGTMVDGQKIPANTPVRIKKNSLVQCADVPLDLSRLQWPKNYWKVGSIVAACVAVVLAAIFIPWPSRPKAWTDQMLYDRYNNSVAMLYGIYHYEISIGDQDPTMWGIPKKCIFINGRLLPIDGLSQKELISAFQQDEKDFGQYGATGFFVSPDGKMVTNLHVVKPWLYNGEQDALKKAVERAYAQQVGYLENTYGLSTGYIADVANIKVEGVLDYIALIPNGEILDNENIIKCKPLKAGDDKNVDIALIQTVSKRLPTADCTYVNVEDSLAVSPKALEVGNHVYTLGFPLVDALQHDRDNTGIKVIGQGGSIIQPPTEFEFAYNAPTYGGASGSPIFNDEGKLIGVHHAGLSQNVTQGYNYGILGSHLKELLKGHVNFKE